MVLCHTYIGSKFICMKKEHYVFVVDDDKSARNGLARLLRTAGYNVRPYASATEFLINLSPEISGCVVLDARMPGLTGEELAEKLADYGRNLAIIFVTADDDPQTRTKANEMNAVGFFRKPVDGTALLDAIDWALKSGNSDKNHKRMFE
jgi:FixJ family two-component response regulator